MFLFNLKKFFFNCWDNFFYIGLFNLANALFLFLILGLPLNLFKILPNYSLLCISGFFLLCFFLFLGVQFYFAYDIIFYKEIKLKNFFFYLKKTYKISLILGLFFSFFNLLFLYELHFYMNYNKLTFVLSFFILWIWIILFLSSLYFYPIFCQLDKGFFKIIKKSVLIFLDNPLFTFLIFIISIFILLISAIMVFIFPGLMGVCVFLQSSLKLRLYKYDYFDENPDAKSIPWDELIKEDAEREGKRSLKNLIFPWKY